MLQAGSERPLPAGSMWVPGMSPQQAPGHRLWVPGMSPLQAAPYAAASPSAREQEIARRRDEMLGMLHGLPESDYELSLTDLVEKTTGAAAGGDNAGMHALPLPPLPPPPTPPSERKEPIPSPLGRPAGAEMSESGRHAEQLAAARTERRGSSRRRGDSGSGSGSGSGRSSFRSSSDGVLLNFYMPRSITRSFTRSFTSPRPSHDAPARAASAVVVHDDSNKRERDCDTVRCWPMPWDRRWRKSSRRDLAGESAAILGAANHPAPEENV